MDFNNFLNKLDESKDFIRVSTRQLNEAMGDAAEPLKKGGWYYVPTKEYNGFRHLVKENGPNDWVVYYLEYIGGSAGAVRDVSSMASGGEAFLGAKRSGVSKDEARDLSRLANYLVEGAGDSKGIDNGVDLTGFVVQRKVAGNFSLVFKECTSIVGLSKEDSTT